jgi:tellurite resistance-related uncharacterized protein
MKALPKTVVAYKKTPEFTELTLPAGLLKDHQTKEGVWGGESQFSKDAANTRSLTPFWK